MVKCQFVYEMTIVLNRPINDGHHRALLITGKASLILCIFPICLARNLHRAIGQSYGCPCGMVLRSAALLYSGAILERVMCIHIAMKEQLCLYDEGGVHPTICNPRANRNKCPIVLGAGSPSGPDSLSSFHSLYFAICQATLAPLQIYLYFLYAFKSTKQTVPSSHMVYF